MRNVLLFVVLPVFMAWILWDASTRCRSEKLYPIHRVLAHKGEWVTNAKTGAKVCRLTRDIFSETEARADDFCEDWRVTPPQNGAVVDEKSGWVRVTGWHALQLHVGDSWR